MKTLDEVIIALEVCTSGYCSHPKHGDCPYLDERNDCDTRQRKLDALHYLKILKAKNEEPPLGEPPDYIPLGFHQLAEMIGEPIYIKPDGCKGHWEILASVKRNIDGDCFTYRGIDREIRLTDEIYRTKKGAEE